MIAREFPFTAAEADAIESALRTYHSRILRCTNKVWFAHVDVDRVLNLILTGEVKAALVEGFLILYEVGVPWYSEHSLVLSEMMVLRVTPGGDFQVVPQFLESKGRFYGCDFVCVGTALAHNDLALARMYERSGYHVEAMQLIKHLT